MMSQRLKSFIFFSMILAAGLAHKAEAANINVTTTAMPGDCLTNLMEPCQGSNGMDCTLQDALNIARCNGEGDAINVGAGTYDADTANIFVYFAAATENFPLTIVGAPGAIIDGANSDECMAIDTQSATSDDQANISISDLTFQNGNTTKDDGGGLAIFINEADVTIENCAFISNTSDGAGGGLYVNGSGETTQFFGNNLFLGNTSSDAGAGIHARSGQDSIIAVNNILARNTCNDGNGGGMFLNADVGDITVTNNTFFNNAATNGDGGGIAAQVDDSDSTFNIYNNIVFGNSAGTNGDDIWTCEQGATVNLFNNDFTQYYSEALDGGSCGASATLNQGNNIPDNPDFVNSGADDFHLQSTSPAIDAGDPAAPSMPPTDFDGNPRPTGVAPDMGALEFQPAPSPTPTPTPTPQPFSFFLEGSGCSLQGGGAKMPFPILLGLLLMGGMMLVLRHKAKSGSHEPLL